LGDESPFGIFTDTPGSAVADGPASNAKRTLFARSDCGIDQRLSGVTDKRAA